MHPFSTPRKNQKTVKFFDVFKGLRKGAYGTNVLSTAFWNLAIQALLKNFVGFDQEIIVYLSNKVLRYVFL